MTGSKFKRLDWRLSYERKANEAFGCDKGEEMTCS
jgi:hypothetical protein